ncbi:protein IMPACT-like [Spodoptera frugiperda]|uniref:Protein IMPACT-like n=1 Tax=Spodoptera frugiperda TaxID=7108 RepID=A0A9R0DVT8_SPOFR|nr:protein IMPACT-like [Spodoptera frugiperda]
MENINLLKQGEEREALASIYEKEFQGDSSSGTGSSYCIKITERNNEAVIHVTMPRDYPSESPPVYELSAPWMDRKTKERLHRSLHQIYNKHKGEIIVFRWVEEIRNFLFSVEPRQVRNKKTERKKVKSLTNGLCDLQAACPDITHGEVITDRKSSFQGHAARVGSVDDVKAVLTKLKMHRKIVNAKHNMVAYRIEHRTAKGVEIVQGYDEDGEAHAGGRLLHLLQTNNCLNTAVVVTRWFGGIQIGGDRFRHITNVAKQAIQQAGLLNKT